MSILRWRGCTDGAEVAHVAVDGGGHVWPGADVYSGGGHVTHTVSAHRVIWRFLQRHRLTTADPVGTEKSVGTAQADHADQGGQR